MTRYPSCGECGEPIYDVIGGVRTCGHDELALLCFRPEPCDCRICEREAQMAESGDGDR